MANSYKLPDDLSQVNYSSTDLLMYSRNGNPNQHWLEEKVAALYHADDAIVFASGVAALHALFWTLLKPAIVWFIQKSVIWLCIGYSMNCSIRNLG